MNWPHFLAAPRVRHGVQSVALGLLVAAITVLVVKVFGLSCRAQGRSVSAVASARMPRFDLSGDQRLVPVLPEPGPSAVRADPPATQEAETKRKLSAAEMFAAADRARNLGDDTEAIRVAKQLEEIFPNSPQGIDAHLLLGWLFLEQGRAELALQEFATFRHIGPAEAKAEALFGQAQALRKLARAADEAVVLSELLQGYPRSAYVAAARIRKRELESDAAPP